MFLKNYFSQKTSSEDVVKTMENEGFKPTLINEQAGYVYELHSHLETKYLVCLSGSMKVKVDSKEYNFEPGDKLIIEASTPHSAVVGEKGCTYLWSEKIV